MDRKGGNHYKKDISDNGRSMHGYILTYSSLRRENICHLRVLNRGDLNFCVLSTLFQEAENIKPHKITSEKLAPERQ